MKILNHKYNQFRCMFACVIQFFLDKADYTLRGVEIIKDPCLLMPACECIRAGR